MIEHHPHPDGINAMLQLYQSVGDISVPPFFQAKGASTVSLGVKNGRGVGENCDKVSLPHCRLLYQNQD